MERMSGIPIGQVDRLIEAGVDLKRLARAGVELFFTQVFRDGYFHADMHPGNIFVATDGVDFGKYIAMDFGIMGTLSDTDKSYLAQNFLAFFRRDYRRVATAHLESGWVPPGTRVDELESEIRVVLEPVFDRPLSQISLGRVLMQLFRASRRFYGRDPAAARAPAEDAAQRRGTRPPARSRSSTCGPPPSPSSSAGWKSRSAPPRCAAG